MLQRLRRPAEIDKPTALVVGGKSPFRTMLVGELTKAGWEVTDTPHRSQANRVLHNIHPDVVVFHPRTPHELGVIEDVQQVNGRGHQSQVLIVSENTSDEAVIRGLRAGAADYMPIGDSPFPVDEFMARMRALRRPHGPRISGKIL